MRFTRERTGERVFDLNTDGVAQYGLFADLWPTCSARAAAAARCALLFRSAEAYLQTWQRAVTRFGPR